MWDIKEDNSFEDLFDKFSSGDLQEGKYSVEEDPSDSESGDKNKRSHTMMKAIKKII
jgi:hypothetical protein